MSPEKRRRAAFAAVIPSLVVFAINFPKIIENRAALADAMPDVLRIFLYVGASVGLIALLAAVAAMGMAFFRGRFLKR